MLGKLFKYEFKATARIFVPLYLALLVLSLINRLVFFIETKNPFFNMLIVASFTAYILSAIAVCVLTFVIIVQRFYKNLVNDEGYLMFTLPVKSFQHVITKLLTSIAWILCSIVLVLISIYLLLKPEYQTMMWNGIHDFWGLMVQYFGNSAVLVAVEAAVILMLSTISSILMIYASISLGQLNSKHKFLTSCGAFIGLYFAGQLISSFFIGGLSLINPGFVDLVKIDNLQIFFVIIFIVQMLYIAGYFITTNLILTRKLNLS